MSDVVDVLKEDTKVLKYDESSIKTLTPREHVRARPTMYIGSLGEAGTYKSDLEVITNCTDEAGSGYGKKIIIEIDNKTGIINIRDFGRGIPIGKLEEILSNIGSGGKFDPDSYNFSGGLNGTGATVVMFLSEFYKVDVWRDGKHGYIEYRDGIKYDYKVESYNGPEQGTLVSYKLSVPVMGEVSRPKDKYERCMNNFAYGYPGVEMVLIYDGKKESFISNNGMRDFFDVIIKSNKFHPISKEPITIQNKGYNQEHPEVKFTVTAYFNWAEDNYSEKIISYANSLETILNGEHVDGFKAALTQCVKNYISKNNILPTNSKLIIDGDCVRENLIGIVLAQHSAPLYSNQIKDKLTNKDINPFIKSSIYQAFTLWMEQNPKEANDICKLAIKSAKAKAAAKEARDSIIKPGSKLNAFSGDPRKFKDCKSNNPEECEIFLVEGDSAGGSASQARHSDYQAIYKLRGKVQNVIKERGTLSDELLQLVNVLGCGYGETFNIKKLRFHKIIFATDADVDGFHITSLLAGFFYTYMFELYESGHIYTAKPPLYQLDIKGKNVFIPTMKHYIAAIENVAQNVFELVTMDGKTLSKELFSVYIRKLGDFKEFMDGFVVQTQLEAELIELIIYNYADIKNKNFVSLKNFGYTTSIKHEINGEIHVEIDREYEHYFLVLDENFEKNVYFPIMTRMTDIKLCGLKLKAKKSGNIYGGLMYRNACLLDSLLMGKDVEVRRLKGLGECQPKDLAYFMFNDTTRNIVRLTIDDASIAAKQFDIFLGKNIEEKKRLLSM